MMKKTNYYKPDCPYRSIFIPTTPEPVMMARTAIAPISAMNCFAWFSSRKSKSRINFLSCLGQGSDAFYVLNAGAFAYMEQQNLPRSVLTGLESEFAGEVVCSLPLANPVDKVVRIETALDWEKWLDQQGIKNKRHELLRVLDKPYLPLHNNLSERDIRDYVKKRKISGSTRSEAGRRCRDTFASLKKTCLKHEISFWHYLKDRLLGENKIPPLSDAIRAAATCG